MSETLDARILEALRYMRRQSDADPNWPRGVPIWTLADDLHAEASEMVGAVNRLGHHGLVDMTTDSMLGAYLRATDAAMVEAPDV